MGAVVCVGGGRGGLWCVCVCVCVRARARARVCLFLRVGDGPQGLKRAWR